MIIKIIKCDNPHSWYFNRVGQSFDVIKESFDIDGIPTYVLHEGRVLVTYVMREDCEIINQQVKL